MAGKYLNTEQRAEQRGRLEDGPLGPKEKFTEWPDHAMKQGSKGASKSKYKTTAKSKTTSVRTSSKGGSKSGGGGKAGGGSKGK